MSEICVICKEDINNQATYNCDLCKRNVHKNCAGLTPSETKCMVLKKRTLKLFCTECQSDLKIPTTPNPKVIPNLVAQDNVSAPEGAETMDEKSDDKTDMAKEMVDCKNSISALHNDVLMLKETNIQLIHLLTSNYGIHINNNSSSTVDVRQDTARYEEECSIIVPKAIRTETEKQEERLNNNKKTKTGFICNGASRKGNVKIANPNLGDKSTDSSNLTWLYLANICTDVTPTDVLEYIDEEFRDHCQCIRLKSKFRTPRSATFKLGVPLDIKEKILTPDFWPKGMYVDNYKTRPVASLSDTSKKDPQRNNGKHRHFQREKSNGNNRSTYQSYKTHAENFRYRRNKHQQL